MHRFTRDGIVLSLRSAGAPSGVGIDPTPSVNAPVMPDAVLRRGIAVSAPATACTSGLIRIAMAGDRPDRYAP
jgi:hypothetical protein